MSDISFLNPTRLLLLIALAALVAAYLWQQRKGRAAAMRFSDADLLASVAPRFPSWRKHLTAALLLVSLTGMTAAWARPQTSVQVAREKASIIVALDVSGSMEATDVAPSRFAAAKAAATAFVNKLPTGISVGLVSFAASATLVVPPTEDRQAVVTGMEDLKLNGGTAIGDAVAASVSAVMSAASHRVIPHVVLLSDGSNTTGRSVTEAEQQALAAHIPVTTIAYGTDAGYVIVGDRTIQVPVDRPALQELATSTGGQYYDAASAAELSAVYDDISQKVGVKTVHREITTRLAGLALLAGLAAAGASFAWGTRLL